MSKYFSIKTFSDALNEFPIVTLDFDFAKVAAYNDKAMDLHGSQVDPHELPHITVAQNKVLEHPEGGAIEDKNGTLLAICLPNALNFIHVCNLLPKHLGSAYLVSSGTYCTGWTQVQPFSFLSTIPLP